MTETTRTASARKSLGEFKPVMVTTFSRGFIHGREIMGKETKVIGTSREPWNWDGSQKQGKFGMYRGVTFPTRAAAVAHATEYIIKFEAAEMERSHEEALYLNDFRGR